MKTSGGGVAVSGFLTTGQVAKALDCSPELVRHLERTGRIGCERAGRYRLFPAESVKRLREERDRTRSAADPVR